MECIINVSYFLCVSIISSRNDLKHISRLAVLYKILYAWINNAAEYHESRDFHVDVIKWKHFPRYWTFVRGIHRSPVNSPHKGQWRRALMFTLLCARINGWVNNREAGDLRRNPAHYDVIVMYRLKGIFWSLASTTVLHSTDSTWFLWAADSSSLFYQYGLTIIPAWIINRKPSKVRNEVAYPFPNFNGAQLRFVNGWVISSHTLWWM